MQEILNQLTEVSYNLFWSWRNDFFEIFEEINKDYWEWCHKNPLKFLESIDKQYLLDIIKKKNLQERINNLYRDFKKYNNRTTYFQNKFYKAESPEIAYFSAEYGITKCLKFYSGGLGTLSGDHLKSASELGIPLIGIGIAYFYGNFRQEIKNNRQIEIYDEINDFNHLPLKLVKDEEYRPVKISVLMGDKNVYAQIWEVSIGKVKLYLLDTLVDENDSREKSITSILYEDDKENRIKQEILLGIGGTRVLEALNPEGIKAYHINEGHSAFLIYERIKKLIHKNKISFKEAKEICYYSNIFTSHTPVSAGIDVFPRWIIEKYLKNYAENELGISFDEFYREGDRIYSNPNNGEFNMAYLAINNSNFVNAVSKMHSEVSKKMWSLPPERNQIDYVTNGIHTRTYLSKESDKIFIRNFGKDWYYIDNIWSMIANLPDKELWELRNNNRSRLINFIRESFLSKYILDKEVITIGFARRATEYKRWTLLIRNFERFRKIILNEERKIQFIFSGRAHPNDETGKYYISSILEISNSKEFKNKIIFMENYDTEIAKRLVSGCDLWLNNPRKPLEASGTSGMKVVANGGLNCSILDGWWCEGYNGNNGWVIKNIDDYEKRNNEEIDNYDANALCDLLEFEIIPLFYQRNSEGIPVGWINKMKESIKTLSPYFNTDRMVREYTEKFYMNVK